MKIRLVLLVLVVIACAAPAVRAQCPTEPQLENFTGGGTVACPCFVPNEQAGAIFDIPAADYPIEILKVRIGWGSQFGGSPDVLENAINIYAAGLPDPGAPIFQLVGPQLTDGVINEFDLEPLPGQILINSGPFSVTVDFFNQNSGDPFAPTMVNDGNGCQLGKNLVLAQPGGWLDACLLGVTGDWVVSVIYRKVNCTPATSAGAVPDGGTVPGTPLELDKFGGGLLLSWSSSCESDDTDYEIYSGTLGSYYSHGELSCSTGGLTFDAIGMPGGDTYYVIVPREGGAEGSYGTDSGGVERPRGSPTTCPPQNLGTCP